MLPWNYGFAWNTGHILFLGAFYTVLVIIATTVVSALWRSRRSLRAHQTEEIRWHSDFHDLPAADRVCRHVLTGEFKKRECPHAFDCRECETHAKLIERHPLTVIAGPDEDVFGMDFPLDRYYHRGHTWARLEDDGTVTVGLDDLGRRLLGAPDSLELPMPGDHLTANGTAFNIRKRGAKVRVLSPIDGEVLAVDGPAGQWRLRVKPDSTDERAFRHLLRGPEVKPWLMREMERLQLALTAEGAVPTLADGGEPVSDISASYPGTDWDAVCGKMFLEG
jgi:glycine cleavage system H lipoate-binding protein